MLASQGPAFVGSWPYRQILIRIFNDVGDREPIKTIAKKIFHYVLHNSLDFQLAGYSFDLCLCDLSKLQVTGDRDIAEALGDLATQLIEGLPDPAVVRP